MKKDNKPIEYQNSKYSVSDKSNENENINESNEINPYYQKISDRFRVAKIVAVSFLFLVIISSLLIYGEAFTYENARYLLRDIGQIISDDPSVPAEKINVQADGDMDFAIFKGNIVVAGESTTRIISASGKEKLADNTVFSSPTIVSSDKYCIVYSLGAYNLSVYNTVARVYDITLDYPIYDVAVADNGYFAIMTHDREHRCVVYLYDSDFDLCATYNKNKYPSSVGITSDGKQVFISTFNSVEGDYYSEISSYRIKETEAAFSFAYSGLMPLDINVLANNNLVCLYQNKIIFIDNTGKILNEHGYPSDIYSVDLNDKFTSVVEGGSTRYVSVYDDYGKLISSYEGKNISRAYTYDKKTFIQNNSVISSIDNIEISIELKNNTAKILYHNGYMFICYTDGIFSETIV